VGGGRRMVLLKQTNIHGSTCDLESVTRGGERTWVVRKSLFGFWLREKWKEGGLNSASWALIEKSFSNHGLRCDFGSFESWLCSDLYRFSCPCLPGHNTLPGTSGLPFEGVVRRKIISFVCPRRLQFDPGFSCRWLP
jgi:hypothetical protein